MSKRWRVRPIDTATVEQFQRAANVPHVVAKLLLLRGIDTPADAQFFLTAKLKDLRDPDLLPGLSDAAQRIFAAVQSQSKITIYGDYDADGMTATAILLRCLKLIGANVDYYIPNRLSEGYGLNADAIRKLAADGTQLIVTVDCGITSIEPAIVAKDLGIELIVTDHHEMGDQLPAAAAIVHPRLPGYDYPFDGLCGAGVALKLAWALCQLACDSDRVSPRYQQFLMSALGIAAIGTIADVVPLVDENRLIVRHGLVCLKHYPLPGIESLLAVTKLSRKPQLMSEDIAFMLAPRLNAAGRLGQAELGVELLTTDDETRARGLAEYVHELNTNRDSLERSIYLAAKKQVAEQFDAKNDSALVLAGRGWHAGVIGIVAGRIAEKFSRPCVVISLDELGQPVGTGSGRSALGLNLYEVLTRCSDDLISYGGHAAAVGLRIDAAHIDRFRDRLCQHVSQACEPEDRIAEIMIDAEATLPQLTLKTVKQIEMMAPFGQSNPRPILTATGVSLLGTPKTLGSGGRHLSMTIQHGNVTLKAIAFGQGEWKDELIEQPSTIDIAFRPVINEFAGKRSVQLQLVDWRPTITAGVPSDLAAVPSS